MEIKELKDILERRVLVLDGAMGTMIQQLNLGEEDFRGERWKAYDRKLFGCNDLLCQSQREAIKKIHKAYIEAGADIISTNTFNANSVSMSDYGLDRETGLVKEINKEGARLAIEAAIEAAESGYRPSESERALIAGSIGPTNRTASMSPDVNDPALRNITYDDLYSAYLEQTEGLIEGGVDLLLFETVFDTLNLKAGLAAAATAMERLGRDVPVMISATVSDKAGRTLSGQTLKAFVTSVEDFDHVISIGLNCSFGPSDILPFIKEISGYTRHFVSCHPNAGLPNALGQYDETAALFASHMQKVLDSGVVNIVGGCCGTTPEHIAALAIIAKNATPRVAPEIKKALRVSGLENLTITPENNFGNVGERCNVAGSRKFLRLIKEKNYEEASRIAAKQVEDGAMILDVNMDDALLDAKEEMVHFLRYIASDPEIARVPIMVDSSDWSVAEAALKNLQGKSIVNSISLKEGEDVFVNHALSARRLGAAVIVMAFDEQGQADTYLRKIEICERAYEILTKRCGFYPEDIIFDVNIMAVATGIEEHNRYGIDFIDAVRWIKGNLPGSLTSGGVSNLSFAFRGKNKLREAMHAVFLYHAIKNGLDMAIVNPATSVTYEYIEPTLRDLIEDVVLAKNPEAGEKLAAYAMNDASSGVNEKKDEERDKTQPVEERLMQALVKGDNRYLSEDLDEALARGLSAVEIIEQPLMKGMNRVGDLFGEGKMFLPQVVKSARTMKAAVDHLKPMLEASATENGATRGKILFATVKGDVHDIGKNICSIVLACNNFEVIDLGVMVTAETIVETVKREHPDIVCLSGLITPSLAEMVNVARTLKEADEHMPILVGGATTSKLHTALKIAPEYDGLVMHMTDASQNPIVAGRLLDPAQNEEFVASVKEDYHRIAEEYYSSKSSLRPLEEARQIGYSKRVRAGASRPVSPFGEPLLFPITIKDIEGLINWKMFFHAWQLTGSYLEGFPYDLCDGCISRWKAGLDSSEIKKGEEALKLYRDALQLLSVIREKGVYDGKGGVIFLQANSERDNLILDQTAVIPMLRRQREGSDCRSVADLFVRKDEGEDYAGIFAVTAGRGIVELEKQYESEGDSYKALLCQTLADRLAEASSEWLHDKVKRELWGVGGIRPAMGYPMLPDQLLNHNLLSFLPLDKLGIELTENGAMIPSASVSGLYIGRPDAGYFLLGEIGEDQIADYAARRGETVERIKEILRQ